MFFCTFIKIHSDLNIYVFSGYRLEELLLGNPDRMFLTNMDYLLDGRYDSGKHEDKNARGSTNQRLYKITNGRYREERNHFSSNKISLTVMDSGNVFFSSIPKKNDLCTIEKNLHKDGIQLEFG